MTLFISLDVPAKCSMSLNLLMISPDLTVFVYNCMLNRRLVYRDNACDNCGYICLLLDGAHFDVLQGVDGVTPAIPREVEPQGLSGERMVLQTVDVDSSRYSSPFVWKWPRSEMDSVIVADTSHGTGCLYSYTAVVKSFSTQPLTESIDRVSKPPQKKQASRVCNDNVQGL